MFAQPIYLLRHGAYDEGTEVLNERGIKQTEAVITHLEHEVQKPTVVSSKGPRAKQTAAIVAKHFSVKTDSVNWLEKPLVGEHFDVESLEQKMSSAGGNRPFILVTNGEFIHQFVTSLAQKRSVPSNLTPLVKGEVMLCKITDRYIEVAYF